MKGAPRYPLGAKPKSEQHSTACNRPAPPASFVGPLETNPKDIDPLASRTRPSLVQTSRRSSPWHLTATVTASALSAKHTSRMSGSTGEIPNPDFSIESARRSNVEPGRTGHPIDGLFAAASVLARMVFMLKPMVWSAGAVGTGSLPNASDVPIPEPVDRVPSLLPCGG